MGWTPACCTVVGNVLGLSQPSISNCLVPCSEPAWSAVVPTRTAASPVARDVRVGGGPKAWTSQNRHAVSAQGHRAPEGLRATADIGAMVAHAEVILMVVPTPFIAATMESIKDRLRPDQARTPHSAAWQGDSGTSLRGSAPWHACSHLPCFKPAMKQKYWDCVGGMGRHERP